MTKRTVQSEHRGSKKSKAACRIGRASLYFCAVSARINTVHIPPKRTTMLKRTNFQATMVNSQKKDFLQIGCQSREIFFFVSCAHIIVRFVRFPISEGRVPPIALALISLT